MKMRFSPIARRRASSFGQGKCTESPNQPELCYNYIPNRWNCHIKSVEEGQTVAASFNTPELFTIAKDLTNMQVIANVDEADIGGVKEGDRVNFTVDAYPDDVFQGTVKQVRLEATTTNNVVTYEVVISGNVKC